MKVLEITAKTILTPTGGFLSAYSHTINPYRGCAYGSSFCGAACYAPEVRFGTPPAPWGKYLEVKINAPALYPRDYDRARGRGERIIAFMSSVTDPYVPQERRYRITSRILRDMITRPADLLVLQTHTPNVLWDLETLECLAKRGRLVVQISIETDREEIPGFARHAFSVEARLTALARLRASGLRTVAVVSPLMPLAAPEQFAERLGAVADGVILDHYLLGDGSPDGARTRRRKAHLDDTVPNLLVAAGFEEWTRLETFHDVVEKFRAVLGPDRVGVSAAGFSGIVDAEMATSGPPPAQGSAAAT